MKFIKLNFKGMDFEKEFIKLNFISIYASAIVGLSYLFFTYLNEAGLDYYFIGFLVLGMGIAGLLWTRIYKNIKNPFFFVILNLPIGICSFLLVFVKSIWTAILGFLLVGFLGLSISIGLILYLKKITTIETRGREIGKLLMIYGLLVVPISIISFFISIDTLLTFFGGMLLLLGASGLVLYKRYSPPETEKRVAIMTQELQRKDFYYYFIAIFMFLLVLGICLYQNLAGAETYNFAVQAGSIFFGGNAFTATGLETSLFYMSLPMPVAAYPVGVLIDRIGRREMFLIGLISNCVGLFLLAFFYSMLALIMTWIFVGIGMIILLNLAITIIIDVKEELSRKYIGICWTFFFFGLVSGILVGIITASRGFAEISLLILVAFPIAIFAVLHAQDTLPSKEEREWWDCARHLFLIRKGICIVHYKFHEEQLIDEDLFAGGITGIISLVQELTKSNEKMDVFSQKDTKILIQYGKHLTGVLISSKNLQNLHHKLQNVIMDYEDIFVDYFDDWDGELLKFNPGLRLIKRHFF